MFLLGGWEFSARMGWIDTFLFSSPTAIVRIFWTYFSSGTIWTHIGITMWETFVGFLIGTFCGIAIAVLLWWWPGTVPYSGSFSGSAECVAQNSAGCLLSLCGLALA